MATDFEYQFIQTQPEAAAQAVYNAIRSTIAIQNVRWFNSTPCGAPLIDFLRTATSVSHRRQQLQRILEYTKGHVIVPNLINHSIMMYHRCTVGLGCTVFS